MKKIFTILIFLTLQYACFGETVLQGGVSMDIDGARAAAFDNVSGNVSKDLILANLIDPNYEENMNAILNGQIDLKDRELCKFSTGIYGVRYKNDPYRAFITQKTENSTTRTKKAGLNTRTTSQLMTSTEISSEVHITSQNMNNISSTSPKTSPRTGSGTRVMIKTAMLKPPGGIIDTLAQRRG